MAIFFLFAFFSFGTLGISPRQVTTTDVGKEVAFEKQRRKRPRVSGLGGCDLMAWSKTLGQCWARLSASHQGNTSSGVLWLGVPQGVPDRHL